METPKVSVIIPVYNTKEFIGEAMQCIVNQTLRELEILVINDGSTDGSLSVLEHIAATDNRIKIITQQNKGQSAARNLGMEHTAGDYIYFMDSDDLLDKRAMEMCYEKCERDRLDFLFFDADTFGATGMFAADFYHRTDEMEDKVYSGTEAMSRLLDLGKYRIPPWLNFSRKSFLVENQIVFPPIRRSEDELHTTQMFLCAERVGLIKEAFFKRRVRENSLMTRRFSVDDMRNYLFICDHFKEFAQMKQNPVITALIKRYSSRMIDAAVRWQARTMPIQERVQVFGMVICGYVQYVKASSLALLLLKPR